MNKYFLKNKKTGEIACPVYKDEDNIIFLNKVKHNRITSYIIDIYTNADDLYKEWTHVEGD